MEQLVELAWSGDVDLSNINRIRGEIDGALDRPGVQRVVIDLGAVRFVDSLGLGMLVYAVDTGVTRGIEVALRHVPERTRDLIHVAGLTGVLTVEAD